MEEAFTIGLDRRKSLRRWAVRDPMLDLADPIPSEVYANIHEQEWWKPISHQFIYQQFQPR